MVLPRANILSFWADTRHLLDHRNTFRDIEKKNLLDSSPNGYTWDAMWLDQQATYRVMRSQKGLALSYTHCCVYSAVYCCCRLTDDTQFKRFLHPYHYIISSISAQFWRTSRYHIMSLLLLGAQSLVLSVLWITQIYISKLQWQKSFPPNAHRCVLYGLSWKSFNWKDEQSNH